mmetsp:Transcript_15402/g.38249  ORF Transcript_15402/g.38249 Transcript_15402/m.38249 type:complete len:131 (+) Transcript_15402:394-786(+)
MTDGKACSGFCARYSVVGMLFMLMVAMMLTYQPFYIGGIEDVEHSKKSAYGAMAMFILTFILSVLYIIFDVIRDAVGGGRRNNANMSSGAQRRRSGMDYDGVMTGPEPHVLQQNNANLDLPPSVEQAHFT